MYIYTHCCCIICYIHLYTSSASCNVDAYIMVSNIFKYGVIDPDTWGAPHQSVGSGDSKHPACSPPTTLSKLVDEFTDGCSSQNNLCGGF